MDRIWEQGFRIINELEGFQFIVTRNARSRIILFARKITMSWDVNLARREKENLPIGKCSDICVWIRDHWHIDKCTHETTQFIGDGYSVEFSMDSRDLLDAFSDHVRDLPDSADPADLAKWIQNQASSISITGDTDIWRLSFSIRGGGDPISDMRSFCLKHDLVMFDAQSGETVDFDSGDFGDTFAEWQQFRHGAMDDDPN